MRKSSKPKTYLNLPAVFHFAQTNITTLKFEFHEFFTIQIERTLKQLEIKCTQIITEANEYHTLTLIRMEEKNEEKENKNKPKN